MTAIQTFIQSLVTLPEADLTAILTKFNPRFVRKNRHLLRQGQLASEYIFVKQGGLRIYFNFQGKEVTAWFAFEGEFFGELSSIKTQKPSRFGIQAMEDTEVLAISHSAMENLYRTYPAWQELGRKLWEMAFLRVVEGIMTHQTLTAEEQYAQLLVQPELMQRVPLKYLASYLGVTPTSLSRLRRKIR